MSDRVELSQSLSRNTQRMLLDCIRDRNTPEDARGPLLKIALRGSSPEKQFSCIKSALQGSATKEQQFDLMQVAATFAATVAAEVAQDDEPARARSSKHTESPGEDSALPRMKSA